jgi:hypothetical protein
MVSYFAAFVMNSIEEMLSRFLLKLSPDSTLKLPLTEIREDLCKFVIIAKYMENPTTVAKAAIIMMAKMLTAQQLHEIPQHLRLFELGHEAEDAEQVG